MDYWEGWVFLIIFSISQLLIIIYLLRKDPDLLERRLKGGPFAENRTFQRVIMFLLSFSFSLIVVVAGFDYRFNWSHVPAFLVIAADVVVLLGFLVQFHVFKENSFASAIIEIVGKQMVISTGPYAVVRHPLYSGALLADGLISMALGSWWGLPFGLVVVVMLILRLLDEEKLLRQSLPGYEEYCQKVQYRLVPHIW